MKTINGFSGKTTERAPVSVCSMSTSGLRALTLCSICSFSVEVVLAVFSLALGSAQIWGGVFEALELAEGNGGADFYVPFYNDHVRGN